MLFKKFRSSSSSSPVTKKQVNVQRLTSPQSGPADNDSKKSSARLITRETSEDYEVFLENAKREAERKEKAILRLAQEAERRRREFNMDPWANRW
jgi:hypothetical protein